MEESANPAREVAAPDTVTATPLTSGSDTTDVASDEWGISESQTIKHYEEDKLGLWQTCAINTLNMFGTGPFLTMPLLFAETSPPGPQVRDSLPEAAI